ncbi:hypothetical protein AB836_02025 [Rickettsiales bacterium (ex Bugula neritina AB1)]|nr:hypothetical protein AB836_02025 [Rickettsiales bacterium (ex Bugula neritina AB1)]
MNNKKEIGSFYEKKAIEYLIKEGYSILNYNFRLSYKEIDIICEKNHITTIVEVKYRKKYFPSITPQQRNNILSVMEKICSNKFCQVDFIYFNKKNELYHLKNILHLD